MNIYYILNTFRSFINYVPPKRFLVGAYDIVGLEVGAATGNNEIKLIKLSHKQVEVETLSIQSSDSSITTRDSARRRPLSPCRHSLKRNILFLLIINISYYSEIYYSY